MTVLVDDWRPKHSLADDPAFLASLEGLDEGLETEEAAPWPPPEPEPARSPSAPRTPEPPVIAAPARVEPTRTTAPAPRVPPTAPPPAREAPPVARPPAGKPQRRRSVLELFPPPPSSASTSPAQGDLPRPVVAPAPRPAPPPPMAPKPSAPPVTIVPERAAVPPAPVETPYAPPEPKAYLIFYGLDEDPFALAPDPRFFYHATSHDQVSQDLLTAIRRREGVVVLTGPTGVGKTTLCRTVVEHLDRRTLTSFVASPARSFEELAATALVDFGVISREELERRHPPASELQVALREFLRSLVPLQAFGVLFIDDAQRVPASVLREAAELAETAGEERLLQIVLVGNSGLERKLRRRDLRALAARVTVRCELEPLEPAELQSYVVHRLVTAGPNPRAEFSDAAFARIHELSHGLPALVNHICDRALDLGAASAASVIEVDAVDEAASALGVEPPESSAAIVVRALVPAMLVMLFLVAGATAAAYVFQDRVASAITRWERLPPLPPRPALPRFAPVLPVPPPG